MTSRNKYISVVTVWLFFIGLVAPVAFMLAGYTDPQPDFEKRTRAPFPAIRRNYSETWMNDVMEAATRSQRYFSDNFAFREYLIDYYKSVRTKIFHSEPFPTRVVHGRDGWLFLGEDYAHVMTETLGMTRFSDQKVRMMTDILLNIKQQLDARGIKFFMAIAPDKQSVYGRYLPIIKSPFPTKTDQLKESLKQSGFDLIDLKEGFEIHPSEQLYYKTDTHWNQVGLFIAYQTLMNRFISSGFTSLKVHRLSEFNPVHSRLYRGDLTVMLRNTEMERSCDLVPMFNHPAKRQPHILKVPDNYPADKDYYETRIGSDGGKLKIVAFTDSFLYNLPYLIDDSFGETIFIRSLFNMDIVKQEKPDIVLFEIVERNIDDLMGVVTEFPAKNK